MKGIQVLGIFVGLYLISNTLMNFHRRRYKMRITLFMIIIWSVMVALFFKPSWAELALPILSTQDMIMSVLVLGILGSFILVSQVWQNVAKVEKKLTELIQNLAIENYMKSIDETVKDIDE